LNIEEKCPINTSILYQYYIVLNLCIMKID
jgi:hypothetical protein